MNDTADLHARAAEVQTPGRDHMAEQYGRLTAWLQCHGRTACGELASACDVPSVTKRISELIRAGWPITRERGHVLTERGIRRRTTFYELTGPHPQADLFTTP